MAVVAAGLAGGAHQADQLALLHILAGAYQNRRAVRVQGGHAAVVDDDGITIAAARRVPAGGGHHTAVGRINRRAVGRADVRALMAAVHPAADAAGTGRDGTIGQARALHHFFGNRLLQHRFLNDVAMGLNSAHRGHIRGDLLDAVHALLHRLGGAVRVILRGGLVGLKGNGHLIGDPVNGLDLQERPFLAQNQRIADVHIVAAGAHLGVQGVQLAQGQAVGRGDGPGGIAALHGIVHLSLLQAGDALAHRVRIGKGIGEENAVHQFHILGEFHPMVGVALILVGSLDVIQRLAHCVAVGGHRHQIAVHIQGGALLNVLAGGLQNGVHHLVFVQHIALNGQGEGGLHLPGLALFRAHRVNALLHILPRGIKHRLVGHIAYVLAVHFHRQNVVVVQHGMYGKAEHTGRSQRQQVAHGPAAQDTEAGSAPPHGPNQHLGGRAALLPGLLHLLVDAARTVRALKH